MLLQDPDPVVRVKAAEAMGHFHWPQRPRSPHSLPWIQAIVLPVELFKLLSYWNMSYYNVINWFKTKKKKKNKSKKDKWTIPFLHFKKNIKNEKKLHININKCTYTFSRHSAITLENVNILKDFSDQKLCCPYPVAVRRHHRLTVLYKWYNYNRIHMQRKYSFIK